MVPHKIGDNMQTAEDLGNVINIFIDKLQS